MSFSDLARRDTTLLLITESQTYKQVSFECHILAKIFMDEKVVVGQEPNACIT